MGRVPETTYLVGTGVALAGALVLLGGCAGGDEGSSESPGGSSGASPAPTVQARQSHTDPRHDVWKSTRVDSGENWHEDGAAPAESDVVAVFAGRTRTGLTSGIRMARLSSRSQDRQAFTFRTPAGSVASIMVVPGRPVALLDADGTRGAKCPGLRLARNGSTVTVNVPWDCLGNPKWVRLGLNSVNGRGSVLFLDDGWCSGSPRRTCWSRPVTPR